MNTENLPSIIAALFLFAMFLSLFVLTRVVDKEYYAILKKIGEIKMFGKCVPNHPEYLTDDKIDILSKKELRSLLKKARDTLQKNNDVINELYDKLTDERIKVAKLADELKPYREAKNRSDFEAAGFSESQTEFLMKYIKENK